MAKYIVQNPPEKSVGINKKEEEMDKKEKKKRKKRRKKRKERKKRKKKKDKKEKKSKKDKEGADESLTVKDLTTESVTEFINHLRATFRAMLNDEGLFEDEATAVP